MVYIENTGLRDCSGFLQIRSHMISSHNVRVLNNPQLVLAGAYKCHEAAPLA